MTIACKTALVESDVSHLMLPDEVQVLESDREPGSSRGRTGDRRASPSPVVLEEAVSRLASSERPLFIVGAGARFDMDPIIELAERVGAPVVTTFKAKGQISDTHPLGCGVLGRSGTPIASWFMNESDLLVVFGASFSNHTGIAEYKPIIQIDYDPMSLGRFHAVDIPVLGHVGVTAALMKEALPKSFQTIDCIGEVAERWKIWRDEKHSRAMDDSGTGINSAAIFEGLSREVDPDAVIAVDVGNNTYSFGRYFEVANQSVLMSGYLGSIGFGLPAAIGAWAAVGSSRQVVVVAGDGGFGQYAMEFTTAVKYGMNLTAVVLVNSELGKISKEQRAAEYDVWQTTLSNPNFAVFAESCGGFGVRVEKVEDLFSAIRSGLDHQGPALVEVITDPLLM
jgi:thiamine pyrophosphate-dependent acetolactate synthase large subunit-like protein